MISNLPRISSQRFAMLDLDPHINIRIMPKKPSFTERLLYIYVTKRQIFVHYGKKAGWHSRVSSLIGRPGGPAVSPPCYTFPIDAQHTRPPLSSLPSIEVTGLSLGVRCASVRNSKASRGWKWAVDTYTDVLLDRQVCFACSLFAPLRLFRVAIAMPNIGRASTVRLRALVLASRSEYTTC